jgi:hypothetical protein
MKNKGAVSALTTYSWNQDRSYSRDNHDSCGDGHLSLATVSPVFYMLYLEVMILYALSGI